MAMMLSRFSPIIATVWPSERSTINESAMLASVGLKYLITGSALVSVSSSSLQAAIEKPVTKPISSNNAVFIFVLIIMIL